MSIYVNNKFRIKRSATQQETMKRLREAKIFDDYKDILMISAVIGYQNKKYVPITKQASDGVLMQFFSAKDYDIMDLLAYAHTGEQSVITSDEKYEIFSSYANGGFPILVEALEIPDGSISEERGREILSKYYELLLTNDFFIKEIKDSDLLL